MFERLRPNLLRLSAMIGSVVVTRHSGRPRVTMILVFRPGRSDLRNEGRYEARKAFKSWGKPSATLRGKVRRSRYLYYATARKSPLYRINNCIHVVGRGSRTKKGPGLDPRPLLPCNDYAAEGDTPSRLASLAPSQAITSDSNQPTRQRGPFPSRTRLGN
jgi:hypothetical protein